jgi:hypothetical protein
LGDDNNDDNVSAPFDEGHRFVVKNKSFKQQFAQVSPFQVQCASSFVDEQMLVSRYTIRD